MILGVYYPTTLYLYRRSHWGRLRSMLVFSKLFSSDVTVDADPSYSRHGPDANLVQYIVSQEAQCGTKAGTNRSFADPRFFRILARLRLVTHILTAEEAKVSGPYRRLCYHPALGRRLVSAYLS